MDVTALSDALRALGITPTATELADILWLAQHAGPPARPAVPTRTDLPEPVAPVARTRQPATEPLLPPPGVRVEPAGERSPMRLPTTGPAAAPGRPVRVSGAPALGGHLALHRALRPLKHREPSRHRTTVDEDATADRMAGRTVWLPVQTPARDRWLELAVVVEQNPSTPLWDRLADEVRLRFAQLGAFLDVRLWHLAADGAGVVLVEPGSRVTHSTRELIDPAGRRLVLLLSDCVSALWRRPRTAAVLREWAGGGPVAILQPLPEHMWSRTALTLRRGRLRAPGPGAANARLEFTPPVEGGVVVPVLELQADWLLPWARMLATGGGEAIEAVVAVFGTAAAVADGIDPTAAGGPERVLDFRAVATPEAYRLAGYLAAAPLTMATMVTVQAAMMPGTRTSHLAEVLYGGIIRPVAPGPGFDFVSDDVRDVLLGTLRQNEAAAVLGVVSAYLEGRPETGPNRITGALPGGGSPAYDRDARVFAEVQGRVLKRLPGVLAPAGVDAVRSLGVYEVADLDFAVIACGRQSGVVQLWDPVQDRPQQERRLGHGAVLSLAVVRPADQRLVVAGCSDGFMVVWDPREDRVRAEWPAHRGAVWSLCSVGGTVISAGADGRVQSWQVYPDQAGATDWAPLAHGAETLAMVWTGEGLYRGRRDGQLWRSDPASGAGALVFATPGGQINAVAAASVRDGWVVATAGGDGRVRIRQPAGNIVVCDGHGGFVNALAAWVADGQAVFASAGVDADIRLWNQQGSSFGLLAGGHRGAVTAMAHTDLPRGHVLVTAGADGRIRQHEVPPLGRAASDLERIFGSLRVRPGTRDDLVGGVIPRVVAAPARDIEAARIVAAAARHGLTVVPRGSGSKIPPDPALRRVDLVVETRGLRGTLPVREGTFDIGAGELVRHVQESLARRGLRLALDPPSWDATVGGMLATNESGPLRYRYGTPADQTAGIRFVDATGTIRDSAGIAGTGGIITSATLRVHPLPAARRWVTFPLRTLVHAGRLLSEVIAEKAAASAIEVDLPAVGAGTVAVLLEGGAGVDARAAMVSRIWPGEALLLTEAPSWWGRHPYGPGALVLRLAAAPVDLPAAVYALRDASSGPVPVRGSGGLGIVHAVLPAGLRPKRVTGIVEAVRNVLVARGGRVAIVAAPPEMAGRLDMASPADLF